MLCETRCCEKAGKPRAHQDRRQQILRKGLSPLATTISTPGSAPVIAGLRLRAGRANSAKGAGRMVAQAISTARAITADTTILVRGDSAFGSRAVVGTCIRHGAQFSVAMARNSAIDKAIAAIGEDAWTRCAIRVRL